MRPLDKPCNLWHSVTECVGTYKQSHASIVLFTQVFNGHSRTSESQFVLITKDIIHSAAFYRHPAFE